MGKFIKNLKLEIIYTWFLALFFFINALSATAKVSPAFETCFLLIYISIIFLVSKYPASFRSLLSIKWIKLICAAVITFYILVSFPLSEINSIPFHEDFTQFYTVSSKGIEILKQGGVFGWDSSLMGGYDTIADMDSNKTFFLLPFMIFSGKTGFHLMIYFFIFAVPYLLYLLVTLKTEDEETRSISLILGTSCVLYYFRSILRTGTIDALMGAALVLASLVCLELVRKRTRFSTFLMTISLVLLFYAHMGMFVLASLFIFLEFLMSKEKNELFRRLATTVALVFFATINFNYFFLKHPGYFILDNSAFSAASLSLPDLAGYLSQAFNIFITLISLKFAPHELNGLAFIFLPAAVTLLRSSNRSAAMKYYWFMLIAFLLVNFEFPGMHLITQNISHMLPIFMALVLSFWLKEISMDHKLIAATILICFPIVISPSPDHFNHISSLSNYNPPLIKQIGKMDGNMILLETRSTWNIIADKKKINNVDPLKVHPESLFAFETGKKFLSSYAEGYHHTKYRRNIINSGTYQGNLVNAYPISTFNGLFRKWGVHYLVLWSPTSRQYFGKYPAQYKLEWNDKDWYVYKIIAPDIRFVSTGSGSGTVIDKDFFEKTVKLNNARKSDEIVVRSNYLENWSGYFEGKPVKLYEKDGQIAFKAPKDGSYSVTLKFPKYGVLSSIAILSLLTAFLLSYYRIL